MSDWPVNSASTHHDYDWMPAVPAVEYQVSKAPNCLSKNTTVESVTKTFTMFFSRLLIISSEHQQFIQI